MNLVVLVLGLQRPTNLSSRGTPCREGNRYTVEQTICADYDKVCRRKASLSDNNVMSSTWSGKGKISLDGDILGL